MPRRGRRRRTGWLPSLRGPRVDKASERNLRARGILPAGMFVVPAEGARLDQYGNMSRGQMIQILSGLGALEYRAGFKGNATQSARSWRRDTNWRTS